MCLLGPVRLACAGVRYNLRQWKNRPSSSTSPKRLPASTVYSPVDTGHDFTVLDQLIPHPVYATQSWVSVLNPSAATFEAVRPLLDEAYGLAVKRLTSVARRMKDRSQLISG
jgi:hypothetical protein